MEGLFVWQPLYHQGFKQRFKQRFKRCDNQGK
jgi:hypothetical protein